MTKELYPAHKVFKQKFASFPASIIYFWSYDEYLHNRINHGLGGKLIVSSIGLFGLMM